MAVYVNNPRFVAMDELVPLSRIMSGPNVANVCYDTAYMANISCGCITFRPQEAS